jgi:hypothetical protein
MVKRTISAAVLFLVFFYYFKQKKTKFAPNQRVRNLILLLFTDTPPPTKYRRSTNNDGPHFHRGLEQLASSSPLVVCADVHESQPSTCTHPISMVPDDGRHGCAAAAHDTSTLNDPAHQTAAGQSLFIRCQPPLARVPPARGGCQIGQVAAVCPTTAPTPLLPPDGIVKGPSGLAAIVSTTRRTPARRPSSANSLLRQPPPGPQSAQAEAPLVADEAQQNLSPTLRTSSLALPPEQPLTRNSFLEMHGPMAPMCVASDYDSYLHSFFAHKNGTINVLIILFTCAF